MVIPKAGFLYKVYQNPVSRSYNDTSKVDDPQQDYFTGEGIGDFVVNIDEVVTQLERGLKCKIRHRKHTAAKKSREVPRRYYHQEVKIHQRASRGRVRNCELNRLLIDTTTQQNHSISCWEGCPMPR